MDTKHFIEFTKAPKNPLIRFKRNYCVTKVHKNVVECCENYFLFVVCCFVANLFHFSSWDIHIGHTNYCWISSPQEDTNYCPKSTKVLRKNTNTSVNVAIHPAVLRLEA